MPPDFAAARQVIERAVADEVFPAAVVDVGTATQVLWQEAFGRLFYAPTARSTRLDTVFDLASLTKVLSSAPLIMRLIERGAVGLDDPVSRYLPRWNRPDRAAVTIRDLLSHCSGLPAYAPLFQDHHGRFAFEEAIYDTALEFVPRSTSVYSDLGFMLLGFILETVAPLPVQFDTMLQQMGGIQDLQFHPPRIWHARTAPTREDEWRGRVLVGEVDDNNAWALGGAAGHAGLFGTASAVGECARHLLQVLSGRHGVVQEQTLRTFVTRREDVPGSSRALGWDTMLPTSSCGTLMSPRAFGHTGFTGTSLWVDPDAGIYVVVLTNRVHPRPREESAIKATRRSVHDAVMTAVELGR